MFVLFGTTLRARIPAAILALLTVVAIFVINYADFLVFLRHERPPHEVESSKNYYIPKENGCIIKYISTALRHRIPHREHIQLRLRG